MIDGRTRKASLAFRLHWPDTLHAMDHNLHRRLAAIFAVVVLTVVSLARASTGGAQPASTDCSAERLNQVLSELNDRRSVLFRQETREYANAQFVAATDPPTNKEVLPRVSLGSTTRATAFANTLSTLAKVSPSKGKAVFGLLQAQATQRLEDRTDPNIATLLIDSSTMLKVLDDATRARQLTAAEGGRIAAQLVRLTGLARVGSKTELVRLGRIIADLKVTITKLSAERDQISGCMGRKAASSCTATGNWVHQTEGIGSTSWAIGSDNIANEAGMGSATGQSTLAGQTLTITFVASDKVTTGTYTWNLTPDCRSGTGTLRFTGPPSRSGETHNSSVSKAAG